MPVVEAGFVWSDSATGALILCVLVVVAAVVAFILFGRQKAQYNEGLSQLNDFEQVPVAVVGALFRGKKKSVGAQEFIATLMALTNAGVLAIKRDEQGAAIGLEIRSCDKEGAEAAASAFPENVSAKDVSAEDASTENIPSGRVDQKALALLSCFSEEGTTVYLSSAKHWGKERKELVDAAYLDWKQQVRSLADAVENIDASALRAQQVLQFAGYACILIAAASSIFFSLAVCTIFLITGAILVGLSLVMQRTITVEQQRARKLGSFLLNGIKLYSEEIAEDRRLVQLALEYACVFTIANKVAEALEGVRSAEVVDEELSTLSFWRRLRDELYTTQ